MNAITPTQSNCQAALRAFLLAVLPGDPSAAPAVFVGTISGTTLTVSKIISGSILANADILGAVPGTTVVGPGSAPSTYVISPAQTVSNPTTMATGVTVIAGQQNRAAEPANPFFAVLTPIRFDRLETNVDSSEDTKFTGSISGQVLTVTAIQFGEVSQGDLLFGTGPLIFGTSVINQISGFSGGTGTYLVSASQMLSSQTLSCGTKTLQQNMKATVQVDFHGSDTTAGDFAQTVSTCLRDEFGVDFFAALTPPLNGVVPAYADDPRQVPFINDSQQYEWRWMLEVCLLVNQIVSVPQQYADSVSVDVVSVDATFPPT